MKIPLALLAHTRCGDKGDTANVGVIVWEERHYPILVRELPAELDTLPGSLFASEPEIEIENQSVGFLPLWRIGR